MLGSLDLIRSPMGIAQAEAIRLGRSSPPRASFAQLLLPIRLQSMPSPVPQLTSFGYLGLWPDAESLEAFRSRHLSPRRARDHLALDLRPVQSFGTWRGADPLAGVRGEQDAGPVLLVTHSRTRPGSLVRFLRADGPVVRALAGQEGQLWAGGFADNVLSLDTGTLSLWRSIADATRFAYAPGIHQEVVKAQRDGGWFSESWFGRFAVTGSRGGWRNLNLGKIS